MWKKRFSQRNIVLFSLFLVSLLWACYQYSDKASKAKRLLLKPEAWHLVTIESIRWVSCEQQEWILAVPGGVRVLTYYKSQKEIFLPGDEVRVYLRLSWPEPARNPGAFDERFYCFSHQIQLKAHILDFGPVQGKEARSVFSRLSYQWRQYIAGQLQNALDKNEAALAAAVLMGEERFLSATMKESFRRSGLTHLLVVSAGNLSLLLTLSALLLEKWVPNLAGRLLSQMLVALFYGLLCNWDASISRAVMMFVFRASAQYFERAASAKRNLNYAAYFMLCINPYYVFRLGFLMSFVCSFAILNYGNRVNTCLETCLKAVFKPLHPPLWQVCLKKALRFLGQGLIMTSIAQLAVIPFNIYLGSPIGPFQWLVNLPAALLVSFLGLLLFLLLPVFLLWPGLMCFLNLPLQAMDGALKLLILIAEWGAEAPLTHTAGRLAWMLALPAWGYALLDLGMRNLTQKRRRFLQRGLGVLPFLILILMRIRTPDYALYFIDVGQGSAVLIRDSVGHVLLYDCGPKSAAKKMTAVCRSLEIEKIDLVLISHMHEDHYGGFTALAEAVRIKNVLLPEADRVEGTDRSDWTALDELESFCQRNAIEELKLHSESDKLFLAEMGLEFVPSSVQQPGLGNEASRVVILSLGEEKILLSGDMEKERWPRLKEALRGVKPLLIQLPHHGAKDALPENLFHLDAEAIVIQVGERNLYGHPHPSVLESLKKQGLDYYRTDREGCITVKCFGRSWSLETYLSGRKYALR